jgi:agmatine/peptidylarginine deiminase
MVTSQSGQRQHSRSPNNNDDDNDDVLSTAAAAAVLVAVDVEKTIQQDTTTKHVVRRALFVILMWIVYCWLAVEYEYTYGMVALCFVTYERERSETLWGFRAKFARLGERRRW